MKLKANHEMIESQKCDWPVIQGMGICCGETPCSVRWVYACAGEGGCLDRSTCPGCQEPLFKGDEGYEDAS